MARKALLPKVHKHASGQARIRLNGKDLYLGKWGTPEAEEEYRRVVGKHLLEQESRLDSPKFRQHQITVDELLAAYWQHAKEYYRDKAGNSTSELAAMADLIRLLRQHVPSRMLCADFGPLRLKLFRDVLVERGLTRPGVNRRIQRTVRIFRYGAESELIPPDVYHGLKSVSGLKRGRTSAEETEPVRPVSLESVVAVLPHLSRRIRAMVELQLATAMRPGEVVIARPCDIDRRDDVWVYRPSSHKNEYRGHERLVRIGPKGQEALRPWLEGRKPECYCFSPAEARDERIAMQRRLRKSKVQPSQRDRKSLAPKRVPKLHYSVASYGRAVSRACELAGIPPWRPNRLRHLAATIIRRDFGLEASQVFLGHKHADVTQTYAERDAALANRVAAEIG